MRLRLILFFFLLLLGSSCAREIEIGAGTRATDSYNDLGTADDSDPSSDKCMKTWTPLHKMANARAVWAASREDVVVAGLFGAMRFDGADWSPLAPEVPGGTVIWGEDRTDLWFGLPRCRGAGTRGCLPVDPLLIHSKGAGTTNVDFGVRSWNDVLVFSSGAAIAVGDNGRAAIRKNGVWQSMDTETTKDLHAVWGNKITNVFVAGGFLRKAEDRLYTDIESGLWHWDGTKWTEQDCCADDTAPRLFVDVHGNFSTDVYLLSNRFSCDSSPTPRCTPDSSVISHWEGDEWRDVTQPLPQEILASLWSSSSSNIYAVGGVPIFDDDRKNWPDEGCVYHYDGKKDWAPLSFSAPPLYAVGGSGHNDVMFVGRRLRGSASDPTERLWTSRIRYGFRSTFEQEGAVGTRGDIWYRSPFEVYLAGPNLRQLGLSDWSDVDLPGLSDFSSVNGNDSGAGVAVTGTGQIAELRNGEWTAANIPPAICDKDSGIADIWGSSSHDIHVVCRSRHLFHFDGTSWGQLYPSIKGWPDNAPIWSLLEFASVWGFDDGTVFFGGSINSPDHPGVILTRHKVRGWTTETVGVRGPIRAIWGRSATDVYAVGYDSVLHFDGSSWTVISCPEGDSDSVCERIRPRALFGNDQGVYIASGDCDPLCISDCRNETPGSGMLLRYDGSKFEVLAEADCFYDVTGAPSKEIYATAGSLLWGTETAQVFTYSCPTGPE